MNFLHEKLEDIRSEIIECTREFGISGDQLISVFNKINEANMAAIEYEQEWRGTLLPLRKLRCTAKSGDKVVVMDVDISKHNTTTMRRAGSTYQYIIVFETPNDYTSDEICILLNNAIPTFAIDKEYYWVNPDLQKIRADAPSVSRISPTRVIVTQSWVETNVRV